MIHLYNVYVAICCSYIYHNIICRTEHALNYWTKVVNLLIATSKSIEDLGGMGGKPFSEITTEDAKIAVGDPIPLEGNNTCGLAAVIFLNKNWEIDFGGELELTPLVPLAQNGTVKIPPVFDRFVMYNPNVVHPVIHTARRISLSCTLIYKKTAV